MTEIGAGTPSPAVHWRRMPSAPERAVVRAAGTVGSGGLQKYAQLSQASPPGGTDAAYWQSQLIGYLGVGSWRVGHEQFDEMLPAPRQAGQSVTNDLGALVGENAFINLGPSGDYAGKDLIILGRDNPLARS
jgi:hypothetical protein